MTDTPNLETTMSIAWLALESKGRPRAESDSIPPSPHALLPLRHSAPRTAEQNFQEAVLWGVRIHSFSVDFRRLCEMFLG